MLKCCNSLKYVGRQTVLDKVDWTAVNREAMVCTSWQQPEAEVHRVEVSILPLEDLFTGVGNVVAPFSNPGLQYETIRLVADAFRDELFHEIVSHANGPELLPPHPERLLLIQIVDCDFLLISRFGHVPVHHFSFKVTWLHYHILYEIPSLLHKHAFSLASQCTLLEAEITHALTQSSLETTQYATCYPKTL